jgi:hypothetical protein
MIPQFYSFVNTFPQKIPKKIHKKSQERETFLVILRYHVFPFQDFAFLLVAVSGSNAQITDRQITFPRALNPGLSSS